jgi:lysophospholipase L1-like esterase
MPNTTAYRARPAGRLPSDPRQSPHRAIRGTPRPRRAPRLALALAGMLASVNACGQSYADDPTLQDVNNRPQAFDGPPTSVVGRWSPDPDKAAHLSWAGTQLRTRFSGTSITASLTYKGPKPENYVGVIVDDGTLSRLAVTPDKTQYVIDGLAPGPHSLTLVKLNEAMDGELAFHGFAPAAGELLPTAAPTGRRIEFIGDSITCGYGNEGVITTAMLVNSDDEAAKGGRSCKKFLNQDTYQVSNAYLSWAAQAATNLKAEYHLICWSGKGVYRNADGSSDDLVPELWDRAVESDAASRWDPAGWVPQVVVINLGTNDFGSVSDSHGPPDHGRFKERYTQLVQKVRRARPNAHIILAMGPMLSDFYPKSFKAATSMRDDLHQIIDTLDDDRIYFMEFPLNIASDLDPTGCEWHPSAPQDTVMAERTQGMINKVAGWKW